MLAALVGSLAAADEISAPNGKAVAVVKTVSATDCEAMIEIIAPDRHVLVKSDFRSKDHESGDCIGQAQWTPDSRFFVFSVEDSGGHQPWHTPIMFVDLAAKKVMELEKFIQDPITYQAFTLAAPDRIEFETTDISEVDNRPVLRKLNLGTLTSK
jgi:hypothetical protein